MLGREHETERENEILLEGCTPVPLAGYLKALGVLRILSDTDPEVRGYWNETCFVLCTRLASQDVEDFLLNEYKPTPILTPWNGGSGFYDKDNKEGINFIKNNQDPRLEPYRQSLCIAEKALAGIDRRKSPSGLEKSDLLRRLRALLPDEALYWFDAAVSLSGDGKGALKFSPLLGSGGNDGRLDFANNFMQRLSDALPLSHTAKAAAAGCWLRAALFAQTTPGLKDDAIGQLSPGQVGGPNATSDFEAGSLMNPWDLVLALEGTLLFASAVTRRHAHDSTAAMSFPFTVRATTTGSGTLGEGDAMGARGLTQGEIWLPLWRRPARILEIRTVLSEGRVALGRKPTGDALDFVRAIYHLGVYRGISAFQRYSFLPRSGTAHLAVPTGRFPVHSRPVARWLDDLDRHNWLDRFRCFVQKAQRDETHGSLRRLGRRLENYLFDLSGRDPSSDEAQSLLSLLGEIQGALARNKEARKWVNPIPCLTEEWIEKANNATPPFRLALALAGLYGADDAPLPLRVQLFPLHHGENRWRDPASDESPPFRPLLRGRLVDTLIEALQRRLRLADFHQMTDKPLMSCATASLDDLARFLQDSDMDSRIAALLPGLALCRIPWMDKPPPARIELPATFGLMKLVMTPDLTLQRLGYLKANERVPVPRTMLAELIGGCAKRAVQTAWRRLRASGLSPLFQLRDLPTLVGIDPRRAAAALLIPLHPSAVARIAQRCLYTSQDANTSPDFSSLGESP
jgi:CRISPR-associated protein Csx17